MEQLIKSFTLLVGMKALNSDEQSKNMLAKACRKREINTKRHKTAFAYSKWDENCHTEETMIPIYFIEKPGEEYTSDVFYLDLFTAQMAAISQNGKIIKCRLVDMYDGVREKYLM